MSDKIYRIIYNPYIKATTVEEYFSGRRPNPWEIKGGDEQAALQKILQKKNPIQHCGMDILKWIDSDASCKYKIYFEGLKQDYIDFEAIYNSFASEVPHKSIKLEFKREWESPEIILEALKNNCNEITKIYENEPDVLVKLEDELRQCEESSNTDMQVLVVGKQNSGKSTFVNSLLGMDLLPTSDDVETASVFSVVAAKSNKITIFLMKGKEIEINFEPNEVKYTSSTSWLDKLIDNAKQHIEDSMSIYEKIRAVLKEINEFIKIQQQSGKKLQIREVMISIDNFKMMSSKQAFKIIDLPGGGGAFLGDEHKALIRDIISDVQNAVVIYVMSYGDENHVDVQNLLKEIKNYDENSTNRPQGQVDFDRSIYIFNRADAMGEFTNIGNAVNRYEAYKDKKVVLTSAAAAMQIECDTTDELDDIEGKYYSMFVKPARQKDRLTDLNEKSLELLPSAYVNTIGERVEKVVEGQAYNEALVRTGVPLVVALLDEYASNTASIHKVDCYNKAIVEMLDVLSTEEKKFECELEKKENYLIKEMGEKRKQLFDGCKSIRDNAIKQLSTSSLEEDFRKEVKELLSSFNSDIESWVKEIEEKKHNKNEKWRDVVEKKIKEKLEKKEPELVDAVRNLELQYFVKFRAELIEHLKADAKVMHQDDAIANLIKAIEKYEPKEIDASKYKVTANFEFGVDNILKYLFDHTKSRTERAQRDFMNYWSESVVKGYSEPITKRVKEDYDQLIEMIGSKIDILALDLINLQKDVDTASQRLSKFKQCEVLSDQVVSSCKNIIGGGKVNV